MNLTKFLAYFNRPLRTGIEENRVVVVLHQSGVGGTPCTEVTDVSVGFDWDNGKIMLRTKDPVVTADNIKRLRTYASAFEKLLATYARENNLKYGDIQLRNSMYPKGTTARVFKELMKSHIEEYLNPPVPKVENKAEDGPTS